MTALEQYIEDMRKNMSSNQLEMKEYFIRLAKAIDADLKAKEVNNSLLDHIPLSSLLKCMKDFGKFKYRGKEGILIITKVPE